MATVSFHGLTKKFTGMAAVDDLRLEIKDGEFVSLLGPSGCGKTTTLRLVAGFLQPDAGEIRVDDKIISSASTLIPPERRNMSMIFQSYAIWPHMTVFQNVAYGLKFKKLAGREIDEKTERLLRVVHLEALKARYPAELSGGQQQRVALARALVVEPQILLLDEPLSNLDANLREEMRFEDPPARAGATIDLIHEVERKVGARRERLVGRAQPRRRRTCRPVPSSGNRRAQSPARRRRRSRAESRGVRRGCESPRCRSPRDSRCRGARRASAAPWSCRRPAFR